ncbi:MAG: hypothetical protein K0S74_1226 [Chlamydiales bacterium]|jgi:hypothetical protein|nr:hypothetical protein [Chlamydiales bacterium]
MISKWIGRIISRVFCLLGAFATAQFPAFVHQYLKHLQGHIQELNLYVDSLTRLAIISNKSLEVYIDKFIQSADPDFSGQGLFMQKQVLRWKEFSTSYERILNASLTSKPFVFTYELNHEIAEESWNSFQFSLSLNWDTALYATCGALMGFILFNLIRYIIQRITGLFYNPQTSVRELEDNNLNSK